MDEIHFADGIDAPERLVLGLGPAQLGVAVCGALAAYVVARSGLAAGIRLPLAGMLAAAAAALAWLRVGGRPLLEWAVFAIRYALRPREGTLLLGVAKPEATDPVAIPAPPAPRPSQLLGGSGILVLRRGQTRCIALFSFKGGVGRTTVGVELACSMAASGRRVALIDLDAACPSVGVRLGIPDDEASTPGAPATRVVHRSGVQVLPWCSGLDPAGAGALLDDLARDAFDVVVADLGSCLSETAVAVLRRATEVLVVAVPTLTGARDAYRSAAVVRRSVDSGTRVGLVVNRVVAGVDLDEVVADLRLPVLGCVPEDAELGAAENQRRLVTLDGHGGAAVALRRLVATLAPASVG